MVTNLVGAGNRVVAWNRSAFAAPDGAEAAGSPAAVGEAAGAAFVMVSDAAAVEEVLFGEEGWASGAKPGSVVIQSSTIGPTATAAIAERVESAGFRFLDAPVSGSVKPAENAALTILGGGDPDLFAQHQELFDAIGSRTVVFGPVPAGSYAKLAVNGLLISVIAAASECLAWLGERAPEMSAEDYASVIERISPLAAGRVPSISGTAPVGGFSLKQAAKDMELVGEEFGGAAIMEAVRSLTRKGISLGFDDRDMACLGEAARTK
jgi:3-hydroxyisobutyrate dehydrogenase-like beta-hydroxyacid dehydrogenase